MKKLKNLAAIVFNLSLIIPAIILLTIIIILCAFDEVFARIKDYIRRPRANG